GMGCFYEVDLDEGSLYELVGNREKLRYQAAVDMIEAVVRRPEIATTGTGRDIVASRVLASRVQVALATNPDTRRYRITVEARDGVVRLEGTAAPDRAVEVARQAPRARHVR